MNINNHIYTSDRGSTSYSGANLFEFTSNEVEFWFNKGYGGMSDNRIPAYMIHVRYSDSELFTITTYEGDNLYNVIEKRVDKEIEFEVFMTAFHNMSIGKFLAHIMDRSYSNGLREGEKRAKDNIRNALSFLTEKE